LDTPDLSPQPGWVDEGSAESPNRSFVSGDPTGQRLRVRYYRDGQERVARVWFGPLAEGPPGHAHGGSIAAVLDEAMGSCCWVQGHQVLAGTLQIVYRSPLPLGSVVTVRAGLAEAGERKVRTWGRVEGPGDAVYAEATGIFVRLRPEVADAFATAMAAGTYRPPHQY
jgi:acyl-coenzyme A thioesterase PaaI-like protein